MKFYLLSDNVDTLVGMRLVGIEGVIIHEQKILLDTLAKVMKDKSIGVILMTTKVVDLCPSVISELKLRQSEPLDRKSVV